MSGNELADTIEKKLRNSEFAQSIDWNISQFLDLGSNVFVEVVVFDAGYIVPVRQRLTAISRELKALFDFIVRAKWEWLQVDDPVVAYSDKGTPRTAIDFPVVLKAGNSTLPIAVAVTYIAQKRLEELHKDFSLKSLKELVKDYVRLQLSLGGTAYWDPIKHPYLEINDTAVSYLISRGIVQAIKDKAVI